MVGTWICRHSANISGIIVLAADEEAVKLFINKKIKFLDIETIIIDCVGKFENIISPTLEQILECDKKVREYVINKFGY